jgi:hypothetical protein
MRDGVTIEITVHNEKEVVRDIRLHKEGDNLLIGIMDLEIDNNQGCIENLILEPDEVLNLIDALKYIIEKRN